MSSSSPPSDPAKKSKMSSSSPPSDPAKKRKKRGSSLGVGVTFRQFTEKDLLSSYPDLSLYPKKIINFSSDIFQDDSDIEDGIEDIFEGIFEDGASVDLYKHLPITSHHVGASSEAAAAPITSHHVDVVGEVGGLGSTSGEDDKGRGDELGGNRSFHRWPRQETLALLKIRSDMDIAFRDASVKGPLWEQVSRKLAELGYNRSAKECKEKFENVYKYYKRTKEGRVGKPDGKTYCFFDQLEESLKNRKYFLYCTLFPLGYEFEKDTLIQLWMAEGFIEERTNERLEDTGSIVFHSFLSKGFIVPLSCDFNDGRPKYKVSDNNGSNLQQFSSNGYLLVEDVVPGFNLSDKWGDTSQLSHLSLHGKIDLITFEAIKKCEYLRTLLINPRHDSCIKLVPRDLFLRLNLLRALKLSQTHISQLPSSIANVKSLRYIDVSETPIITLPESIGSLHKLQTLKLRGCTCFVALPKGMKNLTKLRHLELDIVGQLSSMPPGMGNLINLQNLSGFIVDRHDGFHICELKNLNNLRGEICISRLERVPNSEEAREAALLNKNYLNKLELRWSDLRVEEAEVEEGILECLRPHSGLKELHILFYGGSKLPSWFGHPSFADLTAITLYKFKNCQFLPSLGELPSLKFLYIAEMNTVSEVDYRFCRNREDQGHHAFPKLEILKFDVMLKLEGWMGVQNGDFPSLVKLTLVYCPKLSTLPTLSCLNSLKHLEIKYCPKLISMPNEGLPSSLEFLLIKDCPELKEQCSKGKGQDWCKIAHVPSIWVDNQEISAT